MTDLKIKFHIDPDRLPSQEEINERVAEAVDRAVRKAAGYDVADETESRSEWPWGLIALAVVGGVMLAAGIIVIVFLI